MSAWASDGKSRRGGSEQDDDENSEGEPSSEQDGSAASGGSHADEDAGFFCGEEYLPKDVGMFALLWKLIVSIIAGIAFGFILEKARVIEPMNVRSQMVFRRLVYLKTILSSVAAGMFSLSMMAMLPATNTKFQRACNKFYGKLSERGILACALGGTVMGTGITLAGSDPLVLFAQLGADIPQAWYTLAGAMIGTLLYLLLRSRLTSAMRPMITSSTNPWSESSYFITALPLVAMFSMLVFAFDILIPWELEVRNKGDANASFYEKRVWPPYITGMAIGLLQYPLVMGAEQTLGGSTCYQTVVAQLFIGPLKRLSPHTSQLKWGFRNWWQVFNVVGVMIGAYLSASLSDSFATVRGVPVNHALWGGALMAFGSHVVGGGVYEHGVTGMGLLSILSFIVMTGTFCGSITTALIMRRYRILAP